ncbi:MAG: type 4a pilus biogenesis protein PilO, partial [Endomicrobia bacterium]|nr:type 4a pilus biogenesis protein PilO [Endomicrobiia bacterium]
MKKEQQSLVLVIVCFIIFVVIYFNLLFLPLNKQISVVKQKISEKSSELKKAKMLKAQLPQLKRETQMLELQIAELEKKLPTKPDIPELIKIISKDSQYYNVKILNITTKDIVTTPKDFNEIPFSINFITNYHNLAQFLTSIAQGKRIFAARDLVLSYSPSGDKSNYLNGNCTI